MNISGIGIAQQHSYTAFYVLLLPNKRIFQTLKSEYIGLIFI